MKNKPCWRCSTESSTFIYYYYPAHMALIGLLAVLRAPPVVVGRPSQGQSVQSLVAAEHRHTQSGGCLCGW